MTSLVEASEQKHAKLPPRPLNNLQIKHTEALIIQPSKDLRHLQSSQNISSSSDKLALRAGSKQKQQSFLPPIRSTPNLA